METIESPVPRQDIDRVFAAIADPHRRGMVERLSRGSATVTELAQPLEMRLPSAVKHLKILEAGGLVSSAKVGRTRTYALRLSALGRIDQWVRSQEAAWHAAFDRLNAAMRELEEDPQQ